MTKYKKGMLYRKTLRGESIDIVEINTDGYVIAGGYGNDHFMSEASIDNWLAMDKEAELNRLVVENAALKTECAELTEVNNALKHLTLQLIDLASKHEIMEDE